MACAASFCALLIPGLAGAATTNPTPAGTAIVNIASGAFQQSGTPAQISSNPASLVVLEELGIALERSDTSSVHAGAGQITAVPFVLYNAGNGNEAFTLSGAITGLDAQVTGFAFDSNGDGRFDPAIDTAIAQGGTIQPLAAGGGIRLLALIQSNVTSGEGTLTISGHAVTGFGTPGTIFPGRGDGGIDAIVGPTTAAAKLAVPILANADAALGSLQKSQVVLAPDGSDRPVHGALITYTLAARFEGTGAVTDVDVGDPIPDGTDYVPGSLSLNSTALTDAGGDDAGEFTGSAIQVSLGDVVAPATRTISFQVKIR